MALKISRLNIDWLLVVAIIPLVLAGLMTMRPLGDNQDGATVFFIRQIIWIGLGFLIFFVFSAVDWRFLRNSGVLFAFFAFAIITLIFLFIFGSNVRGSNSWFVFRFFSVEPSDPIKLLIILVLSKYFSRRHVDIANFKHILVSAFYAGVPALLVFFQPDLGSALVIFLIWFAMVSVSGINKRHLFLVLAVVALVFSVSWFFVLRPYQKARILTFLDPTRDPRGAGYNVLQSIIAVGSGQFTGKGFGLGTQSRLNFLPEHRTDFIFAAFAEEWGFIGVTMIFFFFGILIWRILRNAFWGEGNFERLFGIGLAIFLMTHFFLHVGMNIGILPVTGLNMPFLSYGGTNLITIFAGLGILMGMRKYSQRIYPGDTLIDLI